MLLFLGDLDVTNLLESLVFPAAVAVFLLVRMAKGQDAFIKKMSEIQDYQRDTLAHLVTESTETMQENTAVSKELIRLIRDRPCLWSEERKKKES